MDITTASKQELINHILSILVTPNVKSSEHSNEDELKYKSFIADVKAGKSATVKLPLDFAINHEMFTLLKSGTIFIENSIKFITTFTTDRPVTKQSSTFSAKYQHNEFYYSFLDNHPGIINVDQLKDIPTDYEGLMAVPPTVLEYKNITRFNIHRVIYMPKHNGRVIYPRVVVTNKLAITD